MATIKYSEAPAPTTYLSTELNSLADDDTVLGAKVDNEASAELDMYLALELHLAAQASARDAGAKVVVNILPSIDAGTTFNYGDDAGLIDPGTIKVVFNLDAATTARDVVRVNIPIGPFDFKMQPSNETGQAFAASGNTLKYTLYSHSSV